MSADNATVILKTPLPKNAGFEWRVTVIGSFQWELEAEETRNKNCDALRAHILKYFAGKPVFETEDEAEAFAADEEDGNNWTEYGVMSISLTAPF